MARIGRTGHGITAEDLKKLLTDPSLRNDPEVTGGSTCLCSNGLTCDACLAEAVEEARDRGYGEGHADAGTWRDDN